VSLETEIKLKADSADAVRRLLEQAGFQQEHERAFEANTVFDTPDKSLLARQHLLRLREFRGQAILTLKGAPLAGPHKSRPEFETAASDLNALRQIIEALGFLPSFRYEKYRTTFHRPGESGHAVLDETPIGVFLELEGDSIWIDQTAAQLGFARELYITASYGTLWRDHCSSLGIPPGHMLFTPLPGGIDEG
jgi:adenylate cyclase class 2